MASRESQGLQISLILFVMISVVLAVMTFVFYRSAQEAKGEAEDAKQGQITQQNLYQDENFKVQFLQHILGATPLAEAQLNQVQGTIGNDPAMKAISDQFMTDMANYGEGLPAEKRNYRELPVFLTEALQRKNKNNAQMAAEVNQLTTRLNQVEQSEKDRADAAEQGAQTARDDLQQQRDTFESDRTAMQQAADKLQQAARAKEIALENQARDAKRGEEVAQADYDSARDTIETQQKRIKELIDQPFETPDGQIYWVSQRSRTVWINLGLADGLRRQTTFSVFDQEALNVASGINGDEAATRRADVSKGKIEITRVIDQHLAEGRIVEDQPSNPILVGDQVFSPAWKPGRRVKFALVGFMDINEDRRSDRDLIRNVIHQGGGEIDAEVLDDGTLVGELSENTRYLVRGKAPTNTAVLGAYTSMINNSKTLGIQEISLQMLLELMGYKAETRTLPLNRRRSPADAAGDAPDAEAAGDADAGEFKPRRPTTF